MGLGGLGAPLTLGTRAVWMDLLAMLNTALVLSGSKTRTQSKAKAPLLSGTCLSSD